MNNIQKIFGLFNDDQVTEIIEALKDIIITSIKEKSTLEDAFGCFSTEISIKILLDLYERVKK